MIEEFSLGPLTEAKLWEGESDNGLRSRSMYVNYTFSLMLFMADLEREHSIVLLGSHGN
jgi:hypothetical protein